MLSLNDCLLNDSLNTPCIYKINFIGPNIITISVLKSALNIVKQFMDSSNWLVNKYANYFGLTFYDFDLNNHWGFDRTCKLVKSNNQDWINFTFTIKSYQRDKDNFIKAKSYNNLVAIACNIDLLLNSLNNYIDVSVLNFSHQDLQPYKITLLNRTEGGLGGSPLSVYFSSIFLNKIEQKFGKDTSFLVKNGLLKFENHVDKVLIKRGFKKLDGELYKKTTSIFNYHCDYSSGVVTIKIPGNCCCLSIYEDRGNGGLFGETHNCDNPYQQIMFLIAISILHQSIFNSN